MKILRYLIFVFLIIGVWLIHGVKNFPEYAKKEVLYSKYSGLLKAIDESVYDSISEFSLTENLKEIEKPEELIYMALQVYDTGINSNDDEEVVEIVKKYRGDHESKIVINGTGYGMAGGKEIVIIDYNINKYNVESCLMYFEKE